MSCCGEERDFCVGFGATLVPVVRWASKSLITAAVTGITQAAPAVVTAPGHALPNGWPVALNGVQGMIQINATRYPPQPPDLTPGTVVDANTVSLNEVSSADFTPYWQGGFLVYNAPMPLAGVASTLTVWADPDKCGTPLLTLAVGSGITVDTVGMTIAAEIQTDLLPPLTWKLGYYDWDVTDAEGIVTRLLSGTITIN